MKFDKIEEEFQVLQKKASNGDIKAWHAMWPYVINACSACAKKKAVGITIPQLDEKILDAASDIMYDIKEKGRHVDKLSSYVYWRVFNRLYSGQVQFFEKQVSLEGLYENGYYDEQ